MTNVITYKIVSDVDGKLKAAARTACNFWNRYVYPKSSIVIRLGTFTEFGNTIAQAYEPYTKGHTAYGRIEFNTRHMSSYNEVQTAATVAHEIGHTLGYGWDRWMNLFDHETGRFKDNVIQELPALDKMLVETGYDPGTTLAHWDEETFGRELMTGIKNSVEHVLPVTIDVAALLGHKVQQNLEKKASVAVLMNELKLVQFTQKPLAKSLDLDYFEKTPIWEETYTERRTKLPPPLAAPQ